MDDFTPPPNIDIPVNLTNEVDRRVAEVFLLFDEIGEKMVDNDHIGTIMQGLGCFPSNDDIAKTIVACTHKDLPGVVHLGKFYPYMYKVFLEKRFAPVTTQELMDAFRTIDTEGHGYIPKNVFAKIMSEDGDPLDPEELKEVMAMATDTRTNTVPYEVYMNAITFAQKPEDDLYQMAAEIEANKPKPVKKRLSALMG